jgi:cystathionine beta-lyase
MDRRCQQRARRWRKLARGGTRSVERVRYYPVACPSPPNHAVAEKQMRAGGGMVSVELKATRSPRPLAVCSSFGVLSLAEASAASRASSTIRRAMAHASIPAEERRRSGLQDGLIRLSVGIEEPEDLIADLDQALRKLPVRAREETMLRALSL